LPSSGEVNIVNMILSTTGESVTLPENFNVDAHIINFPPQTCGFESSLKKFDKDKVCYILGLLSSIPANNKDLIVEDGYVPILAELVNYYVTDYSAYLDYLRATNVIEWDGHGTYSEGHARRYRWKEPYFSARFVKVPTPKFEKLVQQRKFETIEQYKRFRDKKITSKAHYKYYEVPYLAEALKGIAHKNKKTYRGLNNALSFRALDEQHPFKMQIHDAFQIGQRYSSEEIDKLLSVIIKDQFFTSVTHNRIVGHFNNFVDAKREWKWLDNNRIEVYLVNGYNPREIPEPLIRIPKESPAINYFKI